MGHAGPGPEGEPGQVEQVGRPDDGQQGEGQRRGHEDARHAHGYYCCMEAQAGDEPQGGGHTGPHAVKGGLGEDEDDVRSRGKGQHEGSHEKRQDSIQGQHWGNSFRACSLRERGSRLI